MLQIMIRCAFSYGTKPKPLTGLSCSCCSNAYRSLTRMDVFSPTYPLWGLVARMHNLVNGLKSQAQTESHTRLTHHVHSLFLTCWFLMEDMSIFDLRIRYSATFQTSPQNHASDAYVTEWRNGTHCNNTFKNRSTTRFLARCEREQPFCRNGNVFPTDVLHETYNTYENNTLSSSFSQCQMLRNSREALCRLMNTFKVDGLTGAPIRQP